jgi:hypothetical protein
MSLIAISSYAQNWELCKEGMQSSVYVCKRAKVIDYVNWKLKDVDINKIAVKFIVAKDNIQLVTYGLNYPDYLYFGHFKFGVFKFIKQEGNACYYDFEPIEELNGDECYNSLNEILEAFKTEDTFGFIIITSTCGESDDYSFEYVSGKDSFNKLYNSIIKK